MAHLKSQTGLFLLACGLSGGLALSGLRPGQDQDVRLDQSSQSGQASLDPFRRQEAQQDCWDIPADKLANLTRSELDLLPHICWKPELEASLQAPLPRRGIPEGLDCDQTQWCDENGYCSTICKRGSVRIEPWLKNAIKTQMTLTKRQPYCYSTVLGSHNSAISLADGYGNLDPYFQQYFKWIKWVSSDAKFETDNQILSLTDQLNLGLRNVELDTHWVQGSLRIAHCGGLHSDFDILIQSINVIAKLLGHPIQWDTETVGCDPSLSSIPVLEQRLLHDALSEVRAWLDSPENAGEFLVIYFDDQIDLQAWGVVSTLLTEILSLYPAEQIFTPADLLVAGGVWPSMDQLVAAGKRVSFTSGTDYGTAMAPIIFDRSQICGWVEPSLEQLLGEPTCAEAGGYAHGGKTLSGQIFRTISCELYYGPFNCNFYWQSDNQPLLDELTLPGVSRCGLNVPCPDRVTPMRVASSMWSWAEGHPTSLPPQSGTSQHPSQHPTQPAATNRASSSSQSTPTGAVISWVAHGLRQLWQHAWPPAAAQMLEADNAGGGCAALSASDGRWREVSCDAGLPSACWLANSTWSVAAVPRGACPQGSGTRVPAHAKENTALQAAVRTANKDAAFLPIQGPTWAIP
ncbi:hypothetical protein WJX74_007998 [Apatococcus lobatus]|uniref:Uncharacterized protein n=1 Tax=Apatococcus lobatus TaxID=904363 RepID=A0AAW1S6L2_9CHLO